jgi:crotonobetainyl-CoA:carnitine CoA-transferase CaiB-like acyl-CoA transferase
LDILSDFRVVDFSSEIAGPYATKLWADAGADVIKVEEPGGDPLRRRSASRTALGEKDSALFRYLHSGKRSVVGSWTDSDVQALVEGADVVVESFGPEFDPGEWQTRFPGLVVLSITPFGRTGPWSDRPATEFIIQAESGCIASRGRADQVPYQIGARLIEWTAGLYGGTAALAAALVARQTGRGEHVDCSLLEVATYSTSLHQATRYSFEGRLSRNPARMSETPSIEPTKDGWVGFNTNTRQQFDDFVAMIGHPELSVDDTWSKFDYRDTHYAEWNDYVRPWTLDRTTDEVVELASLFRIPVGPVRNGATVLDNEHLEARSAFIPSADGEFVQPAPPYQLNGERPSPRGPAPALGQHTGKIEPKVRPRSGTEARPSPEIPQSRGLPFEGLRVLDATLYWAGPSATQVLAAMGADVIHLESIQHPDTMRLSGANTAGVEEWWEASYMWFGTNYNKRDLTLDLNSSRGRQLMEDLIGRCDVMIENYSPRVFDAFGLDHARVLEINPRLIYARMPAFGLSGPWRDRVGFAQTMEQLSGLAWMTGHEDDQPRIPRGPCDPLSGYHSLFAVLLALKQREETGRGAAVESAMLEATMNVTAEILIEYSAYGAVLGRAGNRGPDAAPQGLYRCAGDENWLALAVRDEGDWAAVKDYLGGPAWAEDPELDSVEGRRRFHDRIDRELGEHFRHLDLGEAVDDLVGHGVPAGSAVDPRLTAGHPQLAARGFYEVTNHPVMGEHVVPTLPFRYASIDHWVRTAPPTLGQHNEEILLSVLGCDAEVIDALKADKVIGTRPLGL